MKLALGQTNPIIGDIAGNTSTIIAMVQEAQRQGADLVIFPELAIIGYPPRDLLFKPSVVAQMREALDAVATAATTAAALVGYAEPNAAASGRPLCNAVALVQGGKVLDKQFKSLLPTYDVFDETRYFEPGKSVHLTDFRGTPLGLSICEDLWNDEQFVERQLYHFNPIGALAEAGAKVLLNISASPFVLGKNAFRRRLFCHQAARWKTPLAYVNQVGGNDELIFDGNSMVINAAGEIIAQAKDFQEDLLLVDLEQPPSNIPQPREGLAAAEAALVLGLRDYVRKCGFQRVVLGLSGGIDSALVAALAAEALGKENVTGVSMPSRYSSGHSKSDAAATAQALGIRFQTIPIEPVHGALEQVLQEAFAGTAPGLAEENVQARIRGNILMALSNKFGSLLLTTGNKSEVATGYCTLYGDMCGGLAVISDVPKTMVYQLARHINQQAAASGRTPPIPESTLTKPPSAELRPNQTDQDSLPPYDILDAILERYVEREQSSWQIIDEGFDRQTVLRVIRLVDLNEYKRKQMPPGLKVTSRAFGFGRRMPIAQRYDTRAMATPPSPKA